VLTILQMRISFGTALRSMALPQCAAFGLCSVKGCDSALPLMRVTCHCIIRSI